jgi:hypothetical protein
MKKASLLVLLAVPILACATATPRGAGSPAPAPAAPVEPAGVPATTVEEPPAGVAPAVATGAAGAFRFAAAGPAEREAAVLAFARIPSGWPRVREATAAFLGTHYVHSPLGEGEGGDFDRDPRVRYDAVDCVTFVETALALGNAATAADAERLLDEIRYKDAAPAVFANRLHFFEAQWIPEQIRRGYLVDVTRSFAGTATETASIAFTPESWAARTGFREVDVPWDAAPHGTFALPIVPLALAQERAEQLPDGVLLDVVRETKPGIPTIVSHVGFVVVKDGRRFLRHAALGPQAVIDEPIASFLERHAKMQEWKVRGINLLAIRDNSAHAREVLARSAAAAR